jgi:hypothetical protein
MRVPSSLRKFVLTVIFMTVMIGGSLALMRMNRQAQLFKKQQLYHTLAARAFADHIAGCRARAKTDESAAQAIRAKKPVSPADEVRARDLLANARWWRENEAATSKQLEYHTALAHKYGRAASSPWKTVSPDPPAPERWKGELPSQPEVVTFPEDRLEDAEVESWRRMVLEHAKALKDRQKNASTVNAAAAD